jgi:hypothetical protein
MLSTYEMETTMEALEAGRPSLQLEELEVRLAPWGCCPMFGAAAASSSSAAAAAGGAAAAASSSAAAAAAGGGAAAAVGASAGVAVAI